MRQPCVGSFCEYATEIQYEQAVFTRLNDAPWSDAKLVDRVTQKVLDAAGEVDQWHWIVDDTEDELTCRNGCNDMCITRL